MRVAAFARGFTKRDVPSVLTDTTRVELGYSTYVHQSTTSHVCKERASACRTSTELSMDLCVICTRMNTHLYVHVCSVHIPIVERPKVKLNAYICMYGGCMEGLQRWGL